MKKIVAISLMLMILFSGISINIASHYCGGNYKGTEVSFSGKLASCGMEEMVATHSYQEVFQRHCCENVVSSVKLSGNYLPVSFSHHNAPSREIVHIYAVPHYLFSGSELAVYPCMDGKSPPGFFSPVNVEQQVICVFLI
jgi:hypothetical protein